jgi:hypothetical protein
MRDPTRVAAAGRDSPVHSAHSFPLKVDSAGQERAMQRHGVESASKLSVDCDSPASLSGPSIVARYLFINWRPCMMHRIPQMALALIAGAGLAQISTPAANAAASNSSSANASSGPVAYVYVSRPTHIDAFAADANGQLTPVPGSPLANTNVNKLSVTKKWLFGLSGDGTKIYTFSIASNGSIEKIATESTWKGESGNPCTDWQDIQLDTEGTTLYSQLNSESCVDYPGSYISFHILSNGYLQFLGASGGYIDDATQGGVVQLKMAGTGTFGYDGECEEDEDIESVINIYKRESNGFLQYVSQNTTPPTDFSGPGYCAGQVATDSANHLAVAFQREDDKTGDNGYYEGPYFLATYTEDSSGNLATTSNSDNMPEAMVSNNLDINAMSISPSNQFLAVGGYGFQIFHFNGANPITPYSGVLQPNATVEKFAWDKANHLYVLAWNTLYVYTVTASGITQAPGSPYSIPEAGGLIALDLQ